MPKFSAIAFSKRLLVLACILCFGQEAKAQVVQGDVLTLREFLDQVKLNHPISRQNGLLLDEGLQQIRMARGAFDPKFKTNLDLKNYKDKPYYNLLKSKLSIPTWFNADLDVIYERNKGIYRNPEHNVPDEGLLYAGLSLPIGRGLFTDYRRTGVQQAKLDNNNLSLEAKLVLNDLFMDAGKTYWEWYATYQKLQLTRQAYNLAKERFQIVLQKVTNGDAASVDTVEYGIQLQDRDLDVQMAELDYQNARLQMDNYFWNGDTVSIFQDETFIPDSEGLLNDALADEETYASMASLHPEIQQLRIKNNMLELDRTLAFENIKPQLDLSYHYLFSNTNLSEPTFSPVDNHKISLNINTSLLLRKERAKLQLVKIKQQENEFKIQYKRRGIQNKIRQAYNKLETYQRLLLLQQENLVRYQKMMNAETSRFFNGDSDVFRVNYRENKLLESRVKVIDYQRDTRIAYLKLLWTTGTLTDY